MPALRPCLKVALPLPLPGLFDYWPDSPETAGIDWIGCRVKVPFGSRELVGWVTALGPAQSPEASVKTVVQRIDSTYLGTDEWIQTLRWTAQYYHASLGGVLHAATPSVLRDGLGLPETCEYQWQLTALGQSQWRSLRKGSTLRAMAELLVNGPCMEAWLKTYRPGWRNVLRKLESRDLVERIAGVPQPVKPDCAPPTLNAEQQSALAAITERQTFGVHLLEGVTGSGKTEVYIHAIEACLAQHKQALVLVPEIGLTPQLLSRLQSRLPVPIHVLHSNLNDTERAHAWAAMASGRGRVLLGTRSAVFTPLPEAGLLIVDEEHDGSYKQQDGFHYHARDVAVVRAKALSVPIVLGSATPSLETLHNAFAGRYYRHRIVQRAGTAQPPSIQIGDVRKIRLQHGMGQTLLEGIASCLARGGQALVFKNRRGYAPALLCHDCGYTALCPRCDSALTVHSGQKRLHCHHCGHQKPKPPACPDCGSLALQAQGFGTERLEEGLSAAFPDVPCLRVDGETTRGKNGLAKQLAKLGNHPGILVGTQILAKGHDLSNLQFVGVVGVDEGLYSSDFRAHEKLAQLLIQVSGRAGRSEQPGHVLIQTHHPDHPLLAQLLSGGYPEFATQALQEREQAELPPYGYLALIKAESVHSDVVRAFLEDTCKVLNDIRRDKGITVHNSGALPAGMPRRAGRYRWHLVLSSVSRADLQRLLSAALPAVYALKSARKVRWRLDIDPIDFL